jgi:uncharacterized protein with PQ loop repeat
MFPPVDDRPVIVLTLMFTPGTRQSRKTQTAQKIKRENKISLHIQSIIIVIYQLLMPTSILPTEDSHRRRKYT